MIEIKGKANIVAKILADSISPQGIRLTTYELTYPRIIHSELLTHGMLVRNAASSRAIPFAKMVEQLNGRPVRFGQANPGMQDKGEDFDGKVVYNLDPYTRTIEGSEEAWEDAKQSAIHFSKAFYEAGYHKQVYNRLTEPFQMMKTVLSCTEDKNFFWLRKHGAADPTLHELARCMQEAKDQSVPVLLKAGEWHLPYVEVNYVEGGPNGKIQTFWIDDTVLSLEDAIKVSAARCAAVSFRNEGYDLAKTLEVYGRLVGDERKHASAFQHQATPMAGEHNGQHWTEDVNVPYKSQSWEPGVSHVDRDGKLWSAQFKGWIMNRKVIPGENYTKEN